MQRAARTSSVGRPYKTARLVGSHDGTVRSLPGFKRGTHREPDSRNRAAEAFIRQAGAADVTTRLDAIFKELRTTLGYKRSQLTYTDDAGAASIKTPDFDVHLWIEQNPAAAAEYRLKTEVSSFRRPEVIGDSSFQAVFSHHVDTVVVDFLTELDVAAKISELEDRDDWEGAIDDEPDGSAFRLTLRQPPVLVEVTKSQMSLQLTAGHGLTNLIAHSNAALAKLMPAIGLKPLI